MDPAPCDGLGVDVGTGQRATPERGPVTGNPTASHAEVERRLVNRVEKPVRVKGDEKVDRYSTTEPDKVRQVAVAVDAFTKVSG